MNEADVSRQIQQMVRFIRQEAEEKANEISVSAEEEFNIEKLQIVEAEKKKIRQEYERKEKQVEIRKKIRYSKMIRKKLAAEFVEEGRGVGPILIPPNHLSINGLIVTSEYSMQLNASRIKVLQAQDDLVGSMKETASKELLKVRHHSLFHHHGYEGLMKALVVQCLLRLKEPAVLLRCRKDDVELLESVLSSTKEEYAEKAKVHEPEVIIDSIHLAPTHSDHHDHGPSCAGGIVMASRDGKIVIENTLDARLDVVFRKKLPEIRKLLFARVAA